MVDTFCPIPWIFQAVRSNGDVRVCCQANITKNRGVLRKPDGTPYNAGVDSLEKSRNSQLIREIRTNMLNGVWSDECQRCKQEEESGLNSRRTYESEQWKFSIEDAHAVTDTTGQVDLEKTPLQYMDLRFGNLCNLACRMCGPTDSSFWYDDWVSLTNTTEFKDTSGMVQLERDGNKFRTSAYDWHVFDNFWTFLEANLHTLEHVYMAGGEPLLIDRHYQFLQKCIDTGAAKNIRLEYNTNCTTLPPRVLSMWKQFKQVRVGASVDGMGDVLEYQRYPAKWSKVLKNLKTLSEQPDNIVVWLAYTVTAYNVFHMVDFMKWKLAEADLTGINVTKRRPIITHHVAHNPKHLNIRVLPNEVKAQVSVEFNQFVQWVKSSGYPQHVVDAAESISAGVLSYMNSDSYYEEHFDYFKTYTTKLDAIRGQSITTVVPQFKDYF